MDKVPTIVDLYFERPAVIPEATEKCSALLGNFGANDAAVLDVIFGRFSPGGKLPFEIPSSMEAVRKQKEDLSYDSENPLYPFGFGATEEPPALGEVAPRPSLALRATPTESPFTAWLGSLFIPPAAQSPAAALSADEGPFPIDWGRLRPVGLYPGPVCRRACGGICSGRLWLAAGAALGTGGRRGGRLAVHKTLGRWVKG